MVQFFISVATRRRAVNKIRGFVHVNPESVEGYHLVEAVDEVAPVDGGIGVCEVRVHCLIGPHLQRTHIHSIYTIQVTKLAEQQDSFTNASMHTKIIPKYTKHLKLKSWYGQILLLLCITDMTIPPMMEG